ncbi:MAG TPA: hypothetical protein VGD77_17550 [Gemmatimonadaceae bacterium]
MDARPDLALPPLGTLVAGFADVDAVIAEATSGAADSGTGRALSIAQLALETPVELELTVDEAGRVTALGGSTPTQWTATTVLPVFHTMRLRIGRE